MIFQHLREMSFRNISLTNISLYWKQPYLEIYQLKLNVNSFFVYGNIFLTFMHIFVTKKDNSLTKRHIFIAMMAALFSLPFSL